MCFYQALLMWRYGKLLELKPALELNNRVVMVLIRFQVQEKYIECDEN